MDVGGWLLDADPALRWQVLRDVCGASPAEVSAERSRVAHEGWGAALLAAQGEDGQWAGGACFPAGFDGDFSRGQPWTATLPTLTLLREFGVDPDAANVREAVARVQERCRWEHAGQRFFDGEVEPCINGRTVAVGAYFGQDVEAIVMRLVREQFADGGWNCEAENGSTRSSFHSTICVLEGLLEHERATGGSAESRAARHRGERYLLDRSLMRRRTTGDLVDPSWLRFSFPPWWHYDVLRGLEHFRAAGAMPGPEVDEAVALVRSRRRPDGRWALDNTHPGPVHVVMDAGDAQPSRWNTLRALRVLDWYDGHR